MGKPKIGLEIHGYLQTKEKLFCNCKAVRHGKKQEIKPNTHICPICTGQPGAKPMLPNSEAINKTIQIGLMLNCKINTKKEGEKLIWNRKHYSWPDLPKGYQNTISGAYSVPVAKDGKFEKIRIREAHLEEDPAQWNPETGEIDYNRSGLPLIEIVTEPDFSSSEEVELWLKELHLTLSYIKAVDKNAGLKADVNVSTGGKRVEIKNLSSIALIKSAIEYEIERQNREKVKMETRRYDESKGKTIVMRKKEIAEDYRFIPDPDLPVIKIDKENVDKIKKNLPESPAKKLDKLISKHEIKEENAKILYKNIELVRFFEEVTKKIPPKFALPWITIELLRVLNYNKKDLDEIEINPDHFIELLELLRKEKITERQAQKTLNKFVPKSFSPKEKLKGKEKIVDKEELSKIIEKVLENNKKAIKDYQNGEKKALNFLMGKVMKISKGRADSKSVIKILKEKMK